MEKNTLTDNVNEFIQERINESYSKIMYRPEYRKVSEESSRLWKEIEDKINNEKLTDIYKSAQMDMYWIQLEEAYKTGFIDSIKIFLHKKI